jgi:integrase/recombinase XerD
MSALAPSLQAYFTKRLIAQRAASPSTIASYKLTFRLLLAFASKATGKAPSGLDIDDLDAPLITSFLDHLEHDRHNSVATPTTGWQQCTPCSPTSPCITPSTPPPSRACSPSRRNGPNATSSPTSPTPRQKRCLPPAAPPAGPGAAITPCSASPSRPACAFPELAGLTRSDIVTGPGANVRTIGKGRKERRTPLIPSIIAVLKAWLREQSGTPDAPLFPTSTGRHLSRDAIEHRLALYKSAARCRLHQLRQGARARQRRP